MKKIKISEISNDVFKQKGFGHKGCYGSSCEANCCAHGADVDKETYEFIIQHKNLIEPVIQEKIENCFIGEWSEDSEYLGNNAIRSNIRNGTCIFSIPQEKGCILFKLAMEKNIPQRLVPSICRLYPITWNYGRLEVYEEIEHSCDCLDHKNTTALNIFQTQKNEIEDIFEIEENILNNNTSSKENC
jgi:hypothetical protein